LSYIGVLFRDYGGQYKHLASLSQVTCQMMSKKKLS